MTLVNPHWYAIGGEVMSGKPPPTLTVNAPPGVMLSAEQLTGVIHAHKLFCDAIRVSIDPDMLHVDFCLLPDGTQIQLTSIRGAHEVSVWPSGGQRVEPPYRGFVIRPIRTDNPAFSFPKNNVLLHCVPDEAEALHWEQWLSPYRIGKDEVQIEYFVDTERKVYDESVAPRADARYFDTYTRDGEKIYRNAEKEVYLTVPAGTRVPVRAKSIDGVAWFSMGESELQRIVFDPPNPPTLSPLWSRTEIEPPFVGLLTYSGGRPTENKIEYIGYNVRETTWDTRRRALGLLTAAPWVTGAMIFVQYYRLTPFFPTGGWVSDSYEIPTLAPLRPNTDPESYWLGTGNTSGKMYATDISSPESRTQLDYVKLLTDSSTVPMFDDISATVRREVNLDAHRTNGIVTWWNEWAGGTMWTASIEGEVVGEPPDVYINWEGYTYIQGPRSPSPNSPSITTGTRYNINVQEGGGDLKLDETAVAEILMTSPESRIKTIFRTESIRNLDQIESTHDKRVWIGVDDGYAGALSDNNGHYVPEGFHVADEWTNISESFDNFTETTTFNCVSRDYLLADTVSHVYVYIEGVLVGSHVRHVDYDTPSNDSSVSAWTLQIYLVAEFADQEVRRLIKTATGPEALDAKLLVPGDITQTFANRVIRYSSPTGAIPIFAPLWFDQGACPYIAYTTKAELEQELPDGTPEIVRKQLKKFLLSLRFRLLVSSRPLFADPAPMSAVDLVLYVPMLEQMFGAVWEGISFYKLVEILESDRFTVNIAFPDEDVHAKIGIADANPESRYYRT